MWFPRLRFAYRRWLEARRLHRASLTVPWWIRLIAVGKFLKGIGFLILALAASKIAQLGVEDTVAQWLTWVHLDPDHGKIGVLLDKLSLVSPATISAFGLGFFIYAGVLFLEGFGLWFDRSWAEWLVIVIAAGFIPFECYEIIAHATLSKFSALIINVVIVAALIWRLRSKHRAKEKPS